MITTSKRTDGAQDIIFVESILAEKAIDEMENGNGLFVDIEPRRHFLIDYLIEPFEVDFLLPQARNQHSATNIDTYGKSPFRWCSRFQHGNPA